LYRLVGVARDLLEATGQIWLKAALHMLCIFDEKHAFLTFTALATHSYEAQCIDCGVVTRSPHALNALSASTESGWLLSFIVSMQISWPLKSIKLISNVTFLSG